MQSFCNTCDKLIQEYNRERIVIDRRSKDIFNNYNQLNEKQKAFWISEAKNVIDLNEHMGHVNFAAKLLVQIHQHEYLLSMLNKYPKRKKNNWNESLIFELVESKYLPLSIHTETVQMVLSTLSIMSRFQFIMRFISLNTSFGLEHLCVMLQDELSSENFLKNYASYIMESLREIDVKLPSLLAACLTKKNNSRAALFLGLLEKKE